MSTTIHRNALRNRLQVAFPLLLILFSWYTVIQQSRRIEQANIQTYQSAELEVVKNAARAAKLYIEIQIRDRGEDAIHEIEQEVLEKLVKPIRIGKVGDAWIYSPEYVIYDESDDFPAEYIGKSMAEIFAIQKEKGASHYEDMTKAVSEGSEGVGWYMWEPEKAQDSAPFWEVLTQDSGREIAAWTRVVVFPGTHNERIWIIGMSAMLPEIMKETGAYGHIQSSIITMTVITILVFIMLWLLNRAETEVKQLQMKVAALHIEIDEARKMKEVSEIVDNDFFHDLSTRAKQMRARRRATKEGEEQSP